MSKTSENSKNISAVRLARHKSRTRTKIILLFLLAVCVSISVFMAFAWHQKQLLESEFRDIAVYGVESVLLDNVQENIEATALNTASAIADFLYQRDQDIALLAELMPSDESFRLFSESRNSNMIPLYDEITFIDLDGYELFKHVSAGSTKTAFPLNPEKVDITDPVNTFAGMENYWEALQNLQPGEIFVSEVVGANVGDGQRFEGIIRWATPVTGFDDEIAGFVTMALNHDHILNFMYNTAMLTGQDFATSEAVGSYLYIMSNLRTIIAHSRHSYILSSNVIETAASLYASATIPYFTGQYSRDVQQNDNGFGFVVTVIENPDYFLAPAIALDESISNTIDSIFREGALSLIILAACVLVFNVLIACILAFSVSKRNIQPIMVSNVPDSVQIKPPPRQTPSHPKEQAVERDNKISEDAPIVADKPNDLSNTSTSQTAYGNYDVESILKDFNMQDFNGSS